LQDSWDDPVSAEKGTLYYIQELGGEGTGAAALGSRVKVAKK